MGYITQRELVRKLGYTETSEIRDLVRSMRLKGWPVLSDCHGMYKSESRSLIDSVAAALVARAEMIISVAKGLMRKEREPLSLEEQMLWECLPVREVEEEIFRTHFDYITEEELK